MNKRIARQEYPFLSAKSKSQFDFLPQGRTTGIIPTTVAPKAGQMIPHSSGGTLHSSLYFFLKMVYYF